VLKSIALLSAFSCLWGAENSPVREVTSQAAKVSGKLIPAYYKGYVYWAGRQDPLTIFKPDGFSVPYDLAREKTAQALAADTDGTVAIAWRTETHGGIDLFGADGAPVRSIETGRYWPTHLAFGEDHSLWTLGYQSRPGHPELWDDADYMIVRKFLPDGRQVAGYLPRSRFPHGMAPGSQTWQMSNCITVGHDRVGLWVYSGMSGNKTEWVELSLDGQLTGRWRLDSYSNELRVALTSDGHVFIQYANVNPSGHGIAYELLTLDRSSSTWRPVQTAPEGELVSADGDELIFADRVNGPMHLRWYAHP
jgi:hypothetical protein